ncbi:MULTISPECIES: GAF domain-containing protein [Actinomadura]|uniref:GAF domain-containing protein n=1 Tax=Actinomadura litoris TaxID=2678616 RepID=A0A7K1L1T2_9ACTN|nr:MULTISPECIES: GAF domain-containing protein [Actinomadura]MBT2206537.1 GAF domain-containing protein [Actinomadura sp. NEAU-AAG7]MUN38362.1 GAF domain-containing protein [Actinomadura litoris]
MTHEPLYDPPGHLLTPVDPEVPQRVARLRELGLGQGPDSEFDALARDLAETAGRLVGSEHPPFAMVNFVTDRQYLSGLYAPPVPGSDATGAVELGREVPLDHGYCPHVVMRRKALVLDDVCDYPRFAGNPVVDRLGIRTYAGAPLIDHTGTVLGTVCIVDRDPKPWGHPGLNLIKERAADLVELIRRREGI